MTDTRSLIDQLASRAAPVRPLASPLRRTVAWLAAAMAIVFLVALAMGIHPGGPVPMHLPENWLEWSASVLTGVLAAYAVFQISVPGRSASWAWLPALPLALWLGSIGWGCASEFAQSGLAAFSFELHARCAQAILAISLPLGLVLLLMVRHAGAVMPAPTAMLAALSAAALASAGVGLVHTGESSLMVLLWHGGMVVALSLASLLSGRRLFAWLGPVRGS